MNPVFTGRRSVEQSGDISSQYRQQLGLEPRIALQPRRIAPGGMRQRHHSGSALGLIDRAPSPNRTRNSLRGSAAVEMPALSVLSDQKNQLEIRQEAEDARSPRFGAFTSRRKIASLGVIPGEAQTHWHDGNLPSIVESRLVQPKPAAQANTRGVCIGTAGSVNASARCLTCDTDACVPCCLYHRPWFMRQRRSVAGCIATYTTRVQTVDQQIEWLLQR